MKTNLIALADSIALADDSERAARIENSNTFARLQRTALARVARENKANRVCVVIAVPFVCDASGEVLGVVEHVCAVCANYPAARTFADSRTDGRTYFVR